MLENGLNQGAGLRRIAPRAPLRLVAMASHGDQDGELPLLWSLCATWIGLGYPVAVLDVTASESEDNPGLLQLLDGTFSGGEGSHGKSDWLILPAARGMARWYRHGRHDLSPISALPELLPQFEIVLVYAHTDLIATLFRSSRVMPLVALSSQTQALLTAYQSTKLLLLNAQLEPTIVSVVGAAGAAPAESSRQMSKNLQDCTMNFLGHRVTALTADAASARASQPSDAMKSLALRLLENAAIVDRPAALRPSTHRESRRAAARSH